MRPQLKLKTNTYQLNTVRKFSVLLKKNLSLAFENFQYRNEVSANVVRVSVNVKRREIVSEIEKRSEKERETAAIEQYL